MSLASLGLQPVPGRRPWDDGEAPATGSSGSRNIAPRMCATQSRSSTGSLGSAGAIHREGVHAHAGTARVQRCGLGEVGGWVGGGGGVEVISAARVSL